MKIQPYFERLEKSSQYKEFKKKYPASFLIAGFFVIDLEENKNIHQIDFYVPSEKKVAAFNLDGEITFNLLDALQPGKVPEKLELKTKTDLDELEGILLDEMHNRGMSEEIKKIIAVLQEIDGKKIWNLNCVLSGMEILKSHVEDSSKTVLKIEKTSLLEIMKKMPMQTPRSPETKKGIKEELQKIDKVEEELTKEKGRLKKELEKKGMSEEIPDEE